MEPLLTLNSLKETPVPASAWIDHTNLIVRDQRLGSAVLVHH
jgi:hypothetical protein